MKSIFIRIIIPIVFLVLLGLQFTYSPSPLKQNCAIKLRWVKSYPNEKWEDVKTGIRWSLSYLGAELPTDSFIQKKDSTHFILHLDKAGFTKEALSSLQVICDSLNASEEYSKHNCIDLGRFLVSTVHSSWHYYKITGAAKTLKEFIERNKLQNPAEFRLVKSTVASGNRIIHFNEDTINSNPAFIAEEITGDFRDGKWKVDAYEVFDLMQNGQLRFSIYDKGGKLISAGSKKMGETGKPSKCMWCHESYISPLFTISPEVKGGMNNETFVKYVNAFQRKINAARSKLKSVLDYSKRQDHTFSELLYIGFMEPSSYRLQKEWNSDEASLHKKLQKFAVHYYEEFRFLGKLYQRQDMDNISPYKVVKMTESVREPNAYEPDFFRLRK